jgi:hypothetical protein
MVWAIPSASFIYQETVIAPGIWQYDYTLLNTSNPITDLGVDLYDVLLTFDLTKTSATLSLPTGWDVTSGAGFIEVTSQNPGIPPGGTDIPAGSALNGFSFLFDYQAGNLPFEATFMNPNPNGDPFIYTGTTAPVPEPATFILLSSGLLGLTCSRAREFFSLCKLRKKLNTFGI